MSSAAWPRSSASRPTAASPGASPISILTPARPNTLNKTAAAPDSPGARKRKRGDGCGNSLPTDHLLRAPIVLKPHPVKLTAKPYILHPLMLLPRENLPLSALDLAQPHGDLPSSRFFESHIKILDLEGRLGSNVLLARSETNRTTYAIEREGNSLYVLCKLGAWADTERLAQGATVVCNQRMRNHQAVKFEPCSSAVPLITPQMHKESKNRRLVIEEIQSKVRRRSVVDRESQTQSSTPIADPRASEAPTNQGLEPAGGQVVESLSEVKPASTEPDTQLPLPPSTGEPLAPPTAEDIFLNIRTQYWEALYHSMGSVAYFAKGPLSRARAAFHLDCDSNLEMNDLVDFLRSLVMSTILIDKKYRESIPDIIGKVSAHIDDSDHDTRKPKKRKPKKPKLGKDGLYPLEDEHVRRWWMANKPATVGDDEKTVTSTEVKYHISCLRRRETQLQMILILEIIALEPLSRAVEAGEDSQLPGMESQLASREASQEPGSKKRNRINLPVLLDVHADRLCIWQTTMSDETKALAESQVLPDGEHTQKAERANSDPLRDFCVDIIVPFFSARLPELCDSISRKLGGPVIKSTPKEKGAKSTSLPKPKPGAPAKRPATSSKKDKEKTLERVLSNERMRRSVSRGPSGVLALMRSASATTIPGLKREGSEPLVAMIPRGEAASLKEKPANVFSRNADGGDLKAKKKALLDAELKDAISALKKPNRALAVKELVEAAEKRASSGALQPKKLKKQGRVSAVQVKATPANNRFKDVPSAGIEATPSALDEVAPSSSVVPSSTMPRKFANMIAKSTVTATPNGDSIQATPAKASRSVLPAGAVRPPHDPDSNILSSPTMTRKAAPISASQHLVVPSARFGGRDDMAGLPSSPGLAGLFETPVNQKASRAAFINDTPIKSRLPASDGVTKYEQNLGDGEPGGVSKPTSIYERLGWDVGDFDDIDDGP